MAPASGSDDDPADDWTGPHAGDTVVDLDLRELIELEADATTPTVGPEAMPGYELGRHHERAAIFRDHMLDDGAPPAIANEIIRALAVRAGVKLG